MVDISPAYDGYSWARLPTVDRVEVHAGKELTQQYMWCETLVAVEDLEIAAHTSDGKTFRSAVPMAIREPPQTEGKRSWPTTEVLITLAAKELDPTDIWYHVGGWSDEGDTYDTQLADFEEQLRLFWATVMGPEEYLRQRLLDCIRSFDLKWRQISIESSGKVWITFTDGSAQMLQPPELSAAP